MLLIVYQCHYFIDSRYSFVFFTRYFFRGQNIEHMLTILTMLIQFDLGNFCCQQAIQPAVMNRWRSAGKQVCTQLSICVTSNRCMVRPSVICRSFVQLARALPCVTHCKCTFVTALEDANASHGCRVDCLRAATDLDTRAWSLNAKTVNSNCGHRDSLRADCTDAC